MPCQKLYYTLRISAGLPQDIPALDIGTFLEGFDPPSPDVFGDIRVGTYTPAQKPVMTGALLPRLEWAIACLLMHEKAMQLAALYRWQQNRLAQKLDAHLEWIDRFNPTEPQPANELLRDIVEAQTTSYSYVYGYPVVKCLISNPSRAIVANRNGSLIRECTFSVSEYRA